MNTLLKFLMFVNIVTMLQFALVFDDNIVEITTSHTYDLLKTNLCLHLVVQVSSPCTQKRICRFTKRRLQARNKIMDILLSVLLDTNVNSRCRPASMLLSHFSFLQEGLLNYHDENHTQFATWTFS